MSNRKDHGYPASKADLLRELAQDPSAESSMEAANYAEPSPAICEAICELCDQTVKNFERGRKNARNISVLQTIVTGLICIMIVFFLAILAFAFATVHLKHQVDQTRETSHLTTTTDANSRQLTTDGRKNEQRSTRHIDGSVTTAEARDERDM